MMPQTNTLIATTTEFSQPPTSKPGHQPRGDLDADRGADERRSARGRGRPRSAATSGWSGGPRGWSGSTTPCREGRERGRVRASCAEDEWPRAGCQGPLADWPACVLLCSGRESWAPGWRGRSRGRATRSRSGTGPAPARRPSPVTGSTSPARSRRRWRAPTRCSPWSSTRTSVLAVTDELVGALGPDAVWVQASTVGPDGMRRIAAAAGAAAGRLVDGPVLGTRKPAEDGTLVVLASGPAAARATAAPVLDAIGSRTVDVGETVGDASALKLVCNAFVATLNTGIAQSLRLRRRRSGSTPPSSSRRCGAARWTRRTSRRRRRVIGARGWDEPSFAVDGVRKDVGLMREAAREVGLPDDLLRGAGRPLRPRRRRGAGRRRHVRGGDGVRRGSLTATTLTTARRPARAGRRRSGRGCC